MAGTGPAPADSRRRRNEPARGEWVDLPPLERPVLPEIDELGLPGPDGEWRASTRRAWEAWRADPVTAQWSSSDVAHAMDTIALHNAMTASTANEVRIRMDGLGLTPKGKRDLRWRIADGASVPAKRRSPKSSGARRARLSVVK